MKLVWKPLGDGPTTQIDWPHWLAKDQPLDPYLMWADITGLQGFDTSAAAADGRWPILVELEIPRLEVPCGGADCPVAANTSCHPGLGLLEIPGAYKTIEKVNGKSQCLLTTRFITARVSPRCVAELLRQGDLVKRFQLGIPRIPQMDEQTRNGPGQVGGTRPRVVVGVIDDGFAIAHEQFRTAAGVSRICWLWDQDRKPHEPWRPGVYNFGYGAELHHAGIQQVLAQSEGPSNASTHQALAAYRALDYVPHRPHADWQADQLGDNALGLCAPLDSLKVASHGTAVAALAAGRTPPLPRWHLAQGQVPPKAGVDNSGSTGDPTSDQAGSCPLVLVQLPSRTTFDTSGGSLGVHVLDGIHYILQRARTLPDHDDGSLGFVAPPPLQLEDKPLPVYRANRVVINLSYGAVAGPHDGSSMLEEAIKELVSDPTNFLWVVVAAGNAHGARNHARLTLQEGGEAKPLFWTVGPDNLLESYLEIWLPDVDQNGVELGDSWAHALQVQIEGPVGMPRLSLGDPLRLKPAQGQAWCLYREGPTGTPQVVASAIFARRVVQGRRGSMLLLTAARTQAAAGGSLPPAQQPGVAPHGIWRVTLRWAGSKPTGRRAVVHAWAERNDQLWGQPRRQQSTVASVDPLPEPTEHAPSVLEFCARGALRATTEEVPKPFQPELSQGSVSHLGTDDQVLGAQSGAFAVGAYRLADGEMAAYSGSGPTRGSPADRQPLAGGDCATPITGPLTKHDQQHHTRNTGPVLDAPSDVGTALRGLRTVALRNGGQTRLGGTSAAAPLVVRYLANRLTQDRTLNNPAEEAQAALLKAPTPGPHPVETARRATPKPTADDRYRRGALRLKVPGGPD